MTDNLELDKSSWKPVGLSDVVTKVEENDRENAQSRYDRFLKVEHMDAESLHVKRWSSQKGGDEINPTFYKIFRKGQLLFPTRNPHLRRTALAHFDGICGEKTLTLAPNEEIVDPEFLPFLFHSESFYAHTASTIIGSTNPHCRWRDVASYEFRLPPKKQQNELASLLWSIDKVVEIERQALERLKIFREVVFQDLLNSSKGKMKPLSKLLLQKKQKSAPPHKLERYIGLEHINSGDFTCNKYGPSESAQAQCNVIEIGDLCYSKLRPYLDKAFIAEFDAVSTTELLIYDSNEVSKEYILHHLHSKNFVDYVSGQGFGTKMPRVSHKIIGKYEIKVLDDEKAFLDKMKYVMEAEKQLKNKIANSISLQKALINQVF
jgi:type I restriction enzyme S subunit